MPAPCVGVAFYILVLYHAYVYAANTINAGTIKGYYKHDPIYATLIIIFMLLASEFFVAINTACATILSVGTMDMCTESVTDSYKKKMAWCIKTMKWLLKH